MSLNISPTEWRTLRLKNYRSKLRLSRAQALNKLMLFDTEKMIIEFDKICDSVFRSNNEPGISFEERKARTKRIYHPEPDKKGPEQLKLF